MLWKQKAVYSQLQIKEDLDTIRTHFTFWHKEFSQSLNWYNTGKGQEPCLAKSHGKCLFFFFSLYPSS